MPLPLIIPFLVKGAVIATKAIIAQKKVAVVAKTATAMVHQYGVHAVVAKVAIGCTVIGGISWSADRIDDLQECFDLWKQGDNPALVRRLGSLFSKINSVAGNSIVESGGKLLINNGYNALDVSKFVKDCLDLIDEVNRTRK